MKSSISLSLVIATLILASTGCSLTHSLGSRVADTVSYRTELAKTKMELKAAEQEARRLEIENLRRAELNELKKNQVQMVPELQSALSTQFNQQIRDVEIRPNYKAMAQISAAMNQLEEENERIYQEQLAAWVKEQGQQQKQTATLASFRPFCKLHGLGCGCQVEPDCSVPPKEPVKRPPPKRPKLPVVDVPMTVEFSIRQEFEIDHFIYSKPGKVPVKEPCLPKEEPCGDAACDQSTASASGNGLYRTPNTSAPIPTSLRALPGPNSTQEQPLQRTAPVPVPVVPIKYLPSQTVMNYSALNPLR